MTNMPPTMRLIACLAAAAACGCSSRYEDAWSRARPPTFSCTGAVEHRGQPVVGALVNFAIEIPDTRRPEVVHTHQAVGFTGPDGRFGLKTFREGDGAVAGTHRVRIVMPLLEDPAAPAAVAPPPAIPTRYASFEASGLTAEVNAGGPNHFVFQLAN
jgi:hypothetical protein